MSASARHSVKEMSQKLTGLKYFPFGPPASHTNDSILYFFTQTPRNQKQEKELFQKIYKYSMFMT